MNETSLGSISRRRLLAAGGGGLVVASAVGCEALSTGPAVDGAGPQNAKTRGTTPGRQNSKEAPELAAQVKQGKLSPLDERLPEAPLAVQPTRKVGRYGGTYRDAIQKPATSRYDHVLGYEFLLRWKPDIVTGQLEQQIYVMEIVLAGYDDGHEARKINAVELAVPVMRVISRGNVR